MRLQSCDVQPMYKFSSPKADLVIKGRHVPRHSSDMFN